MTPRSVVPTLRDGAWQSGPRFPRHRYLARHEVERVLARASRCGARKDGTYSSRSGESRRPLGERDRRVPVVHRSSFVDRHAKLEEVVHVTSSRRCRRQDVREDHRMTGRPVGRVFRCPSIKRRLMMPYWNFVERDLLWCRARRGVSCPSSRSTNSESLPCSHSVCTGSTEFSMICSQLQLIARRRRTCGSRARRDEPVERGISGAGNGPRYAQSRPRELSHRVARGRDLVLERRSLRVRSAARGTARAVELPAVIGAADAVLGRDAVRERRAPVRAVLADQAELAAAVLEEDEILAEDTHALRPALASSRRRRRSGASSAA